MCFGGGFKYMPQIKFSPCRKAVLMSTDLTFQLLIIAVNIVLRVSFDPVGDSFSEVFILSSLNPQAT